MPQNEPKTSRYHANQQQRKCRLAIGVNAKKTGIPESQDNGIPTDKNESPQKAKNDDNPERVAKKMKKNAFFCRSV